MLSKPIQGERLYNYLVVSEYAISVASIGEEEKVKWHVYYVSKRLLDAETCYQEMEKLAFALVIASRKLRPYFCVHIIEYLTNYQLRQIL